MVACCSFQEKHKLQIVCTLDCGNGFIVETTNAESFTFVAVSRESVDHSIFCPKIVFLESKQFLMHINICSLASSSTVHHHDVDTKSVVTTSLMSETSGIHRMMRRSLAVDSCFLIHVMHCALGGNEVPSSLSS